MEMFERFFFMIVDQQTGIAGSYIEQTIFVLIKCVNVERFYWHCYILILPGFYIQQVQTCGGTYPHVLFIFLFDVRDAV